MPENPPPNAPVALDAELTVMTNAIGLWRISDIHGTVHIGGTNDDPMGTVYCGYTLRHPHDEPGMIYAAPGVEAPGPICPDCVAHQVRVTHPT